jgi:hypothetical protein
MKQSKHPRLIALALSIAVLIVAGIIAVTMYKCQLFNEGTAVYETFIFTTIAAIAGGVAAFWAGMTVAKPLLDTYLERTGYGLAKRTIYFQGDEEQVLRIKKDLRTSNLIKAENYDNPRISLADADLVILCIRKEYESAEKDNPDFPQSSNKPKIRTSEYTGWLESAHHQIDTITNGRLVDSQALIVFTDGWLDYKAKSLFAQRSFTTLVNTPGRIVSDIHSLLTTLPPRIGE